MSQADAAPARRCPTEVGRIFLNPKAGEAEAANLNRKTTGSAKTLAIVLGRSTPFSSCNIGGDRVPYKKLAQALKAVASVLEEDAANEETVISGSYKKRRRYKPKEAPGKEYEFARHATEEEHRTTEELQWRKDHFLQWR